MEKIEVVFCSSNPEKLADLRHILGERFLVKNIDIELTEIQGRPDEIAIFKSKQAFDQIKKPLVVEDTSLVFNAFKELPGPYVKHFLTTVGVYGMHKMLKEFEDKTGFCQSTFGYVDGKGVKIFEGKTEGTIVEPRGPTDTGWNSIFIPSGFDRTFSEMTFVEKNQVSHRYKAGMKLKNRVVREIPFKSRFEILKTQKKPVYVSECVGTPRREYQLNLINGIRLCSTFNPYVKLNKSIRYRLDNWPSRNWDDWNPNHCYVRGGRKRFLVPKSFLPIKDELGHSHPPLMSGRYKADVRTQYYFNGLPWIWDLNFYSSKVHYHDREILFPKTWYRSSYRSNIVDLELKNLKKHLEEYQEHFKLKKRYSFYEKAVSSMAGEELSSKYIRQRKIFKIS